MTQLARPITDDSGRIIKPAEKQGQLAEWMDRNRRGIRLPPTIDIDRLKFQTFMLIRKNPQLLECDFDSILNAVLFHAMNGLYPGPLAHIVKFASEAVPITDYKGLVKLMREAGARKVEGVSVHEGDNFYWQRGTSPRIDHTGPFAPKSNPLTHAYCVLFLPDGETQFEVYDRPQIDAVMARSPAVKAGRPTPWKDKWDYIPMAIKCPTRAISKWALKGSEELARVVDFEERMEAGLKASYDHDLRAIEADAKTVYPASMPEGYEAPAEPEEVICPLHDVAFFKTDKMKSPAHKFKDENGVEQWCNAQPKLWKDELAAAAGAIGWDGDQVNAYCKEVTGKTWSQLNMAQVQQVLADLRGMAETAGNEPEPEPEEGQAGF